MLSSSSALFAQGLRSACRIAARSRALSSSASSMSSARAHEASVSHLLQISGYTVIDKRKPTGFPVKSIPFHVGGREWEFGFYPNGIMSPSSVGAVLMPRLTLSDNSATRRLWGDDPMAEYRVSILDRAGNQVFSRSVGPRVFSYSMDWDSVQSALELEDLEGRSPEGGVLGWAIVDLVSKREFRRALPNLLDNDCLSVRCDVTALDSDDMETASPSSRY